MSSSVSGPGPLRASISAFLMADSDQPQRRKSQLVLRLHRAFIASVIFSRSTSLSLFDGGRIGDYVVG